MAKSEIAYNNEKRHYQGFAPNVKHDLRKKTMKVMSNQSPESEREGDEDDDFARDERTSFGRDYVPKAMQEGRRVSEYYRPRKDTEVGAVNRISFIN
mmetsp:Transcript_29769/g.45383  ORF Transcript_29769/g.45383 Transcript_29769/m.45383 type:complete len:97 (-) Transcript_29769:2444-2734(-)